MDQTPGFGETAKSLSRNPLGIIALFIVLVYGFASLVTAFAGSFTSGECLPLIYFLVVFPVFVLGAFLWLVSKHSGSLYAPSDFKNEDNYVKMQMSVVASLTAAAKGDAPASEAQLHEIVETVRAAGPPAGNTGDAWRNQILWVDDRPENNNYERQAFEKMGLRFSIALSTNEVRGDHIGHGASGRTARGVCLARPAAKRGRPNTALLLRFVQRNGAQA